MLAFLAAASLMLTACAPSSIEDDPPPIGDFRLGHLIVSDKGAEMAPISRAVPDGLLKEDLEAAIQERLGRYKGRSWYHLSVGIGPYSLSAAGVPVVASPRSAVIIEVTVWDDATASKLNEAPHAITVIEPTSIETIIGSGLIRSPEEQAAVLADSAAYLIEHWLKSDESPLPGVGKSN